MTTRALTTIRPATLDDLDRLVVLARHFIEQTVYAQHVRVNLAALDTLGRQLLAQPGSTILVTVDADGLVVGMLGLTVYEHPMSGEPICAEVMWWIEPEARGCGVELLCAGEQWARAQGAVAMHVVAPTAEVGQLYTSLDYTPIEHVYQRRLD